MQGLFKPHSGLLAVGLLSVRVWGGGWGLALAWGAAHPLPRFPETGRDPARSPPAVPLSPLWRGRGVPAAALPAGAQVRLGGEEPAAPASDRLGRRGEGEDGRGSADPGISPVPSSRCERLLNLDFGGGCAV